MSILSLIICIGFSSISLLGSIIEKLIPDCLCGKKELESEKDKEAKKRD